MLQSEVSEQSYKEDSNDRAIVEAGDSQLRTNRDRVFLRPSPRVSKEHLASCGSICR